MWASSALRCMFRACGHLLVYGANVEHFGSDLPFPSCVKLVIITLVILLFFVVLCLVNNREISSINCQCIF